MHPLRHPRNAALVGIIFIVIGFLYWGLRSVRLVAICLTALVSGLVITAGFAAAELKAGRI